MKQEVTTALVTVIVGTTVYSLGKLTEEIVVKPLGEQRAVIGEIAVMLAKYARHYHDPSGALKGEHKEASECLRQLSGQLRAKSASIPFYWLIAKLPGTRARNINKAARLLMFLSNSVGEKYEHFDAEKVYSTEQELKRLLKISAFSE